MKASTGEINEMHVGREVCAALADDDIGLRLMAIFLAAIFLIGAAALL